MKTTPTTELAPAPKPAWGPPLLIADPTQMRGVDRATLLGSPEFKAAVMWIRGKGFTYREIAEWAAGRFDALKDCKTADDGRELCR